MLQLSVLQHSADVTALEAPTLTENVWEPVAGHSEEDAHPLKICGTVTPDEVATKSKVSLLMLDSQHFIQFISLK